MKRDAYEMALLFDFYGETLTEKQRSLFDLYYNQDLSLSEIAQLEGISRQGVHDAIARAESSISALEGQLGCVAAARQRGLLLEQLKAAVAQLPACAAAQQIVALAEALSNT